MADMIDDFDGDWYEDGDNYDYVEDGYDMAVSISLPVFYSPKLNPCPGRPCCPRGP
jgi:hypothetical protein